MLAIVSLFGMVGAFSASAFADRVPDGEECDVLVRFARVARQWDDEKSEWVEKGVIDFETKVFKSRGNRKEDLAKIKEMIKEQKIYYFGFENFFFDEKSEIKQPEECDEYQVYTVLPSKIELNELSLPQ